MHIAFSVCGTWLATCSPDGTICVWLTSTWGGGLHADWTTTTPVLCTVQRGHTADVWCPETL